MKRLIIILGLFTFAWINQSYAAEHPVTHINIISAPFGTGPYVLFSTLEEISKKYHPWLRLSHSETPGYIFNHKKLGRQPEIAKNTVIGTGRAVSTMAVRGEGPFDNKYPAVKVLANFAIGTYWLATLNPSIRTKDDLIGKKIAIGRTAQISWGLEPAAMIRHGWGIYDKVDIQNVGTKEAVVALLDGLVDAAIIGAYFNPQTNEVSPAPTTIELQASGKKIYHIPWGEEAVKKTTQSGLAIFAVEIPANIFEGFDKPMVSYGDSGSWAVAPQFPEEIAYEFTKLVIDHIDKFGERSKLGKLMSPKGSLFGWDPEEFHPGAIRAYKEAGIWKGQ